PRLRAGPGERSGPAVRVRAAGPGRSRCGQWSAVNRARSLEPWSLEPWSLEQGPVPGGETGLLAGDRPGGGVQLAAVAHHRAGLVGRAALPGGDPGRRDAARAAVRGAGAGQRVRADL